MERDIKNFEDDRAGRQFWTDESEFQLLLIEGELGFGKEFQIARSDGNVDKLAMANTGWKADTWTGVLNAKAAKEGFELAENGPFSFLMVSILE